MVCVLDEPLIEEAGGDGALFPAFLGSGGTKGLNVNLSDGDEALEPTSVVFFEPASDEVFEPASDEAFELDDDV